MFYQNRKNQQFFLEKRPFGVHHLDPLSPYLFILAMEILSATVKNDPTISGIQHTPSENQEAT
jgi:hypothetical protein